MNIVSKESNNAITQACDILVSGGIIVYPTDTIYGFGVDAKNDNAIHKLNRIKGRQQAISVLAPDKKTALSWGNLSIENSKLIENRLGGNTTVIFSVKDAIVSPLILGENNTLGVRIPHHKFCNTLSSFFTNPITTTSVNKHGSVPLNNPELIIQEFEDNIGLLIDGGNLEGNQRSAMFKLDCGELIQIR
ncbi:MAG: L-threonylcarbamoyladenylate synthase [Fidelibacterota bacterium]